jgi:hypothetical protein
VNDTRNAPASSSEDFSIVLGGPLYQLYRKTRLAGSALDLLKRRLIGIPAFCWVPIAVLVVLFGRVGSDSGLPFLHDIQVHGRFLAAIPLMVLAEFVAHRRLGGIVRQFVDRGLVAPDDLPRFEAIKASCLKLRNSVTAEVIQLVIAFAVHWIYGQQVMSVSTRSWIGWSEGGEWHYTPAGFWYSFVSMPIFRLMLLRWYYRTFIWYLFLWRVGRLDLRLDALHPDRAAGLGFLAGSPTVFTPLLLAHSVLVAAVIQSKIWFQDRNLPDFKFEIGGILAFALLIALTPLFFFVGKLAVAKRRGGAEYGALASRYVAAFRDKWMSGRAATGETLVGSADIQSLADLSGAYDAVRETRFVPLTRQAVFQLLLVTAIPLVPLALNMLNFEELLEKIAGFVL